MMWLQQKDQTGSFVDPETGWRITLDEVRLLQEPAGHLTQLRMNAGGLVPVPAPTGADPSVEEEPDCDPEPVVVEEEQAPIDLGQLSIEELRAMCQSRGLKYSNRSNRHVLILKLGAADGS